MHNTFLLAKVILVFFLAGASFFPATTHAQAPEKAQTGIAVPGADFADLRMIDIYTVDQVIDPLRVRLKNGDIVQLATIEIPGYNPYEPGEVSAAALDYLKELLPPNTQIRLYQTKDAEKGRTNRMGYRLGHIERRKDDLWIQGALLTHGHARILPSAHNPEMAIQMLALEKEAQQQKRGLWAMEKYAALTPETVHDSPEGWVIVEGKILKTAIVRNTVYLNFGDDWRTDFTIAVKAPVRRQLSRQGIDLLNMAHETIRIHGWLESYNGPYIELNHPVWLEKALPERAENTMLAPARNN